LPSGIQLLAAAVAASRKVEVLARAIEAQRVVVIGANGSAAYPLGLVDNAGTWYLVADLGGQRRVIDVATLDSVRTTERRFHRPADFSLRRQWEQSRATQPDSSHPSLGSQASS
jgi:predicted DNA-binding transcriptional regulator YafY